MNVWLWDAPGPARSGSGVSGVQDSARKAAEACLLGGDARAAKVEEARLALGADTLVPVYQRTGNGWQARLRRGKVTWRRYTDGQVS